MKEWKYSSFLMRSDFQNKATFLFRRAPDFVYFLPLLKETLKLKMKLEHWWNDIDKGKQSTRRKTSLGSNSSTTNPTLTGLRSNPVRRCGKPATIPISCKKYFKIQLALRSERCACPLIGPSSSCCVGK